LKGTTVSAATQKKGKKEVVVTIKGKKRGGRTEVLSGNKEEKMGLTGSRGK